MQGTVLQKIIEDKAQWVAARKIAQPLTQFQSLVQPSQRNFYHALRRDHPALILECKKASPSKGLIRDEFDPEAIARVYGNYASAISVLTDEPYFQGDYAFLPRVSREVSQPILCKDFMIDPYQVWLARYYQADAILLMLSVLDDEHYLQLAALADKLQMGVLTEVSNHQELARAIQLKAKVIGINNRDLRDLSVDLDKSRQLAPLIPEDTLVISESGIYTHRQLAELSGYVDGFLVGSSLMSAPDLRSAVRRLVYGENKVCGLTRKADVVASYQAGAYYGGLIFAEGSPRQIDARRARELIAAAPLQFVGVFRNQSCELIAQLASELGLSAVQLHGEEDQATITKLRQRLPDACQIWKALSISDRLPATQFQSVDRLVFDQGQGGSGQTFDWSLLNGHDLSSVIIAGGINRENCQAAYALESAGLDINSGVESAPGIKDPELIQALFAQIRPRQRAESLLKGKN